MQCTEIVLICKRRIAFDLVHPGPSFLGISIVVNWTESVVEKLLLELTKSGSLLQN